ncbi:EamA family transporter [Pseudomonas massiliensis]|uniref:EamA family transporter n=1 Tax=Pseudomonas massiliensis TaxID=522492 RepID=UPI000A004831|nr:EamA family transporter [Pseudomonas massiliensis]
MARALDYLYILATVLFTVYGQLILKWRIEQLGPLPASGMAKIKFLVLLPFDPAIFSGFAAAYLASLTWMAAMSKFELSHAYPFMSLNFVIVILFSGWLFHEPISAQKIFGIGMIVVGTIVAARG